MLRRLSIFFLSLFFVFSLASVSLAQYVPPKDPNCPGGGEECKLTNPLGERATSIPQAIGLFIKFIIGFIGSGALLMFVWGGLKMILARGDSKAVQEAKQTMTWATYGLVIIFFSYAIVNAVTASLDKAGQVPATTSTTP